MKKLLLISFLFLSVISGFAAISVYHPAASINNIKPAPVIHQQQMMLYALSHHLNIKQYQHLLGKRLTLKQKLTYTLLKHKLIKTGNGDETGSAVGGFLLGFTLGIIGVAITYIFSKNRTFRKWSWIGLGAWVALFLVIALIVAASLGGWN